MQLPEQLEAASGGFGCEGLAGRKDGGDGRGRQFSRRLGYSAKTWKRGARGLAAWMSRCDDGLQFRLAGAGGMMHDGVDGRIGRRKFSVSALCVDGAFVDFCRLLCQCVVSSLHTTLLSIRNNSQANSLLCADLAIQDNNYN